MSDPPVSNAYDSNDRISAVPHGRLVDIVALQRDLAAAGDARAAEHAAVDQVRRLALADGAVLVTEEDGVVTLRASAGVWMDTPGVRVHGNLGMAAVALAEHRSVRVDDFDLSPELKCRFTTVVDARSGAAVPLPVEGGIRGVLAVAARRPGAFDDEVTHALELAAGLVASGIRRARDDDARAVLATENTRVLAALRASEERFRAAFDRSAVGMALVTPRGHIVEVNTAFCTMLGYSEDELLKSTVWGITHPADIAMEGVIVRGMFDRNEASAQVEKRLLRRDGQVLWAKVMLGVLRAGDGAVQYVVGQIEDITARRLAQEALARENTRLAAVSALQRDIAAAGIDRASVEALVVERVQSLTGADGAILGEIVGDEVVYRTSIGRSAVFTGQRVSVTRGIVGVAIAARQAIRVDDTSTDARVDRALQEINVTRALMAAPLIVDGVVKGVLAAVSGEPAAFDDQALRTLELMAGMVASGLARAAALGELRDSEERFRSAFDHSAVGMCLVASNGRYLEVNRAFQDIAGRTEAELVGREVASVTHPDDLVATAEALQATLSGTVDEWQMEKRICQPDGRTVWVQVTSSPVRSAGEGVRYVVTQVQDITRRRQAEQLVRESLREKDVLLREIHHRVKNNLTVVNSILRLKTQQVVDPVARAVLLECQDRVRAIALLHEKLYGSRDLAAVDMADYVAAVVQGIVRAQGTSAAVVRVDAGEVRLDPDAAVPCGLLLNELVTNALKHAFPPGRSGHGRIDVTLRLEENQVTLTVADDGVGMPVETDPVALATLGMPLVRALARQVGGTLTVTARTPPTGTVCTVCFPAVREDEP